MTIDLAWAAGFFDGEGSICVNHARHKGGTTGKYYQIHSPQISLSQVRREPLDRFVEIIGIGKVGGPYTPRHPNASPYYKWQVQGRPTCARIIHLLWTHLSLPKREQITEVWQDLLKAKGPKSPPLPTIPKL